MRRATCPARIVVLGVGDGQLEKGVRGVEESRAEVEGWKSDWSVAAEGSRWTIGLWEFIWPPDLGGGGGGGGGFE